MCCNLLWHNIIYLLNWKWKLTRTCWKVPLDRVVITREHAHHKSGRYFWLQQWYCKLHLQSVRVAGLKECTRLPYGRNSFHSTNCHLSYFFHVCLMSSYTSNFSTSCYFWNVWCNTEGMYYTFMQSVRDFTLVLMQDHKDDQPHKKYFHWYSYSYFFTIAKRLPEH